MNGNVSNDIAKQLYATVIGDIKSRADEQAHADLSDKILAAEEKAKVFQAERDIAIAKREVELMEAKVAQVMTEKANTETALANLKAEHQERLSALQSSQSVISTQKALLRDMELKISALEGRLSQAEKRSPAVTKKVVQSAPLPSFDFKPVRDHQGNIVSVTATPIGG